jgi:hypothetical protein
VIAWRRSSAKPGFGSLQSLVGAPPWTGSVRRCPRGSDPAPIFEAIPTDDQVIEAHFEIWHGKISCRRRREGLEIGT